MEISLKTQAAFRKAEMRMKLKDCQGVKVREYQHQVQYLEGENIWYHHQDLNAWLCPYEVVYNGSNKVWLHTNGNIQDAATSVVEPYELVL